MSLSKSKCWYSNNSLHFLKCAVPLRYLSQTYKDLFYECNLELLFSKPNCLFKAALSSIHNSYGQAYCQGGLTLTE